MSLHQYWLLLENKYADGLQAHIMNELESQHIRCSLLTLSADFHVNWFTYGDNSPEEIHS